MRVIWVFTIFICIVYSAAANAQGVPTLDDVAIFKAEMKPMLDSHGRVTSSGQERIFQFETRFAGQSPNDTFFAFQTYVGSVGGILKAPPVMGPANESFWLKVRHFLSQYQSTPELPERVKVLVIGGGLAGLGAAKKLGELYVAGKGGEYVILDKNGIAEGASGHNGGNKQPALERFIKWYQSLVSEREKFLHKAFPWLSAEVTYNKAVEQTLEILKFGAQNSELMNRIVTEFAIRANVSDAGWLRLSNNAADEVALWHDVKRYLEAGVDARMLTPEQILVESGLTTPFKGKLTPHYGNYHPYDYITQAFEALLKQGALIYTQTEVTKIDWTTPSNQSVVVHTNRGTILADKVIVATDAFGSKLLPQLSMIEPYQSHVLVFDHVENNLQGRTVTERDGDLYFNGPKGTWYVDENGKLRMSLVVGGGPDEKMADVDKPKMLKNSFDVVIEQITERYPELKGQPPTIAWTYGFGFTPDGVMIWGPLKYRENEKLVVEERIFIAGGGSQGYGGATQVRAGYGAAEYVTAKNYYDSIEVKLKYDPKTMFDMGRYFTTEYLDAHPEANIGLSCAAIF